VVMLRRGIRACETFAVQATAGAGWRELLPDLESASAAKDDDFRVHVILALRTLGGLQDHTDQLIAALTSRSESARMSAAIGARHFALAHMRAPLLERVRRDPSWLVQQHAAESLLDLADIYPRSLNEHPAIAKLLMTPKSGGKSGKPPLGSFLGIQLQPTPEELARFAEAARQLDALIAERLAAGPCSKATPFDSVPLYVLAWRGDPHVAVLAVEHSIGPCERTLELVVFVRSANGFGRWLQTGSFGKDALKTSVATLPAPLAIEYHRATHTFSAGDLTLDTTKVNVAVLSNGDTGVAVRHQSKQDLTFKRHGRLTNSGFDVFVSAPEITDEIRALVDRSSELRAAVSPATPPP